MRQNISLISKILIDEKTGKIDKDRIISILAFLVSVGSLMVAVLPNLVNSDALNSIFDFVYWLYYTIRFNLYLLIFPVLVILYLIVWKNRRIIKNKNKNKIILGLLLFIVLNSISSALLFSHRNYYWLSKEGKINEINGNLKSALFYYKQAEMFELSFSRLAHRRVYNKLLVSRSLYKSYKRIKNDKLSLIALEYLAKAVALNENYSGEIQYVLEIQKDLDENYVSAINSYRNNNQESFISKLKEINNCFQNYGYSKTILNAVQNKKVEFDFEINKSNFDDFKNQFLNNKSKKTEQIVELLTSEFKVDSLYFFWTKN